MSNWQAGNFQQIFQFKSFRFFRIGFSLSILGDTITRVALTWFVYESTKSAQALLGWLTLCYTGPVILGGLLAGLLLPLLGLPAMVGLSALLIGAPGLLGYRVKALRAPHRQIPSVGEPTS